MSKLRVLPSIALLAIGIIVTPALAGEVTVGRFYAEIARVRHIPAADAAAAEAGLRAQGFRLPSLSLNKSLTEGDVVGISHALGIGVSTQRPSQPFGDAQLAVYSEVFGGQLKSASVGAGGNVFRAFGSNSQGQDGNNQGQNNNNQGQKSRSTP
jgi:hypothetical protein